MGRPARSVAGAMWLWGFHSMGEAVDPPRTQELEPSAACQRVTEL